jgi:aldose 1-epimerase
MIVIDYKKISQINDRDILLFRITNSAGAYIELLNYGATLVSVVVPDKNNRFGNVILSFRNIEDYFSNSFYLGSTIGRFANRISNARFCLNGEDFHIDKNDGNHSLHGGDGGFSKKIFDFNVNQESVTFYGESFSGESGFPGNIQFSVTYLFSDNNELLIEYKAASDRNTPLSMTNHAYFNLFSDSEDICAHELKVFADEFLEMNDEFLPTGNILPLANSAFDFTEYRKIGHMISLKKEKIKGYNTYFISRDQNNRELKILASVKEPRTGRKLDVYSTMPGIMFYTGDYLSGKLLPFGGLCIEAQFYPDFVNHLHFHSSMISPGKSFDEKIKYVFTNKL